MPVHKTNTWMVKETPAEVPVGGEMALKVRAACSLGCDLRGQMVAITAQDAICAREIELTEWDGAAAETDEFVVKVPAQTGDYLWTAQFPACRQQEVDHEESCAPFSFRARPHITSIAAWDMPSPIVLDARFKIKVGVSCSAGCKLTGQKVDVYDHQRARVATGTLGDVPWSDTAALYWAEVELDAPGAEGYYEWGVKFPTPDLELAHQGATAAFAFGTARPPAHLVTVEVIDSDTGDPVRRVQVTLHSTGAPYRADTDDNGVAKVTVPDGKYRLYVTRRGYRDPQMPVEVAGDLSLKVELVFAPPTQR